MNAITILKLGFDNLNKLVKNQFIKQGTESGLMARLGGSWKQGHAYFQALSRPWEQLPASQTRIPCHGATFLMQTVC